MTAPACPVPSGNPALSGMRSPRSPRPRRSIRPAGRLPWSRRSQEDHRAPARVRPVWMASVWISRASMPYSSWYSSRMVAAGSFPGLRTGTNPACRRVGQHCAEDIAAGLDTHDLVDACVPVLLGQNVRGPCERVLVLEQRRDITEHDPRFRKIRNAPDRAGQFVLSVPSPFGLLSFRSRRVRPSGSPLVIRAAAFIFTVKSIASDPFMPLSLPSSSFAMPIAHTAAVLDQFLHECGPASSRAGRPVPLT